MFKALKSLLRMSREMGPNIARDSLQYRIRKTRFDLSHKPAKPTGELQSLGAVRSVETHERGLKLTCENGSLRLTVIAADCIQVRMQPNGKFEVPFSYAVAKVTWPEVPFTSSENERTIRLQIKELSCTVNRVTSQVSFDFKGRPISQESSGIAWRDGELRLSRSLPSDEMCLGLAEQATGLEVRGHRYPFWNTSPTRYVRGTIPMYFTIPFYLGVGKDYTFGLFWDNPSRGWVDVGAENPDEITFCAEKGELRYYAFGGTNLTSVLNRYTELTGRMPLPPLWALGFHQSRWSYATAERVLEIAEGFRTRNIPCDALYLDIDYMDGYRCFTWNRTCFPAPALLVSDLQKEGFKTVVILDPGIKVDPGYKVDQSGLREEVFVTYPNGKPFVGPAWAGSSHFPDFTNPKTRAWWAAQFETLAKIGVAGVWNDMNEPVIFNIGTDRQMPDAVRHDFEGKGATHVEGHNLYGMLMARASQEGLERWLPGKRPFNITRAAHAGAQRYASSWTGDNISTWDHLRLSISMTINCGLSGIAFTGPDIGGFGENCEPELYVRWLQLGAMLPYFRGHSAKNTANQEPWSYGQPYENMARKAIELRYQLLPYLYSLFAQCSQSGAPIVRPLFMADPGNERLRSIDDAFLLGENMLVAPVLDKGATERQVILPRGDWYDWWTQQPIRGEQAINVSAPLDRLPLFVRAGAVIPLWPVMQYVGQKPIDELHLKVYAGEGEVSLYEDAGEGLNYQLGDYRWLYFTCKPEAGGGLSLDWRRAGRYKPGYDRVRVEVLGIPVEPQGVLLDGKAAPLWYYEKGIVEFTANQPFDSARILERQDDSASEDTLLRPPKK